jgi:CubicO group peptidase (beta-lactamase class C family)
MLSGSLAPSLGLVRLLAVLAIVASGCAEAPAGDASPPTDAELFPPASPEEVGVSPERLQAAVDEVQAMVDRDEIVGAVLLVVRRGRLILHEAVGMADRDWGEEMRTDHIVRMRSMTKPLLGTGVLMLAEEGRLSLDDPIHVHLPEFDNDLPGSRDITIYHLLTHTAGLSGSIYTNEDGTQYMTLREAVRGVAERGPAWQPGSDYSYSDPGSSTLGALIAEISGMPSEEFLYSRILEPLGMDDSFLNLVPPEDPRRDRMASTYQRDGDGGWERYWDRGMEQVMPFFRASGGLYSTAMDYARFIRAIADGGSLGSARLVSPETVDRMLQPYSGDHLDPEDATERRSLYGLHWTVFTENASPETPGTFGHGGSDGTYAWYDPTEDLLGVWITQSRGNGLAPAFRELIYEALEERGTPQPSS